MHGRLNNPGCFWQGLMATSAGATLLASSCSPAKLQALVTGLEAVASELERINGNDDDINFGDWLGSELRE